MGKCRLVFVLIAALSMNICGVQASQFSGAFAGAKLGINSSKVTDQNGATIISSKRTVAYAMQGGYLQGGYNLDLKAVIVGVGAYYDWNAYAKHYQGIGYGSRSYGLDAKFAVPLGGWMPYAKIGYGKNKGTYELSAVSHRSRNSALGIEYKFADHWSTVGEYKLNKFTIADGSMTIRNKTVTLGLNYYFDEPKAAVAALEPEPEPIPELAPIPEPVGPEPEEPPAIPEQTPPSTPEPAPVAVVAPVPEVWKTLMEEKPVTIEGTNFARGSAKLDLKAGKEILKEVVEFMHQHPGSQLVLIGYTDNIGSDKQNAKLSLDRANSVKKYLVDAGIPAEQISTKGEGAANPIADNNTREGRARNRRVEIHSIIKEEKKVPVGGTPEAGLAPIPVVAPAIASSPTTQSAVDIEPVRFDGSNFVPGSGKLKLKSYASLDKVAKAAIAGGSVKLVVTGYYVDEHIAADAAVILSASRANSIKAYLVNKGVPAENITAEGKGKADPLGDNKTAKGRALNRRMEIKFVN